MSINTATAHWDGDLMHGKGSMKAKTGAFDLPYSLKSRTESTPQSNPEELIGAAHAGCYTMMTAALLTKAGTPPRSITTSAHVHLDKAGEGFVISRIELETEAAVPGIDEAAYQAVAENAKANCPVSVALKNVPITLKAKFLGD